MNVEFIPVKTETQQTALAELADQIWHEYWPAIIGEAQTDYMVDRFQSLAAIKRDMAEANFEYWLITATEEQNGACQQRVVGYAGGHDEPETNRFFISKIYLLAKERGCGFASKTIAFFEDLCRDRGFDAMYLTVNKHNDLGIRAYVGKGFKTIDAVETSIGEGFVMDDYIMEKTVR